MTIDPEESLHDFFVKKKVADMFAGDADAIQNETL